MGRTDAPVSFTMPAELKEEFVAVAKRNQRSVTQELIIAAREHIQSENSGVSDSIDDKNLASTIKKVILEMKEKNLI